MEGGGMASESDRIFLRGGIGGRDSVGERGTGGDDEGSNSAPSISGAPSIPSGWLSLSSFDSKRDRFFATLDWILSFLQKTFID